jgi:hypothetical protein
MQCGRIGMRRFIILMLLLCIAGCAKKDAAEALAKSTDSWNATLQLVADARLSKKVGAGFAKKAAEEAIDDLTKQLADPSLPKQQLANAAKVIGAAGDLRRAIESDDTAGMARTLRALAAVPAKSR